MNSSNQCSESYFCLSKCSPLSLFVSLHASSLTVHGLSSCPSLTQTVGSWQRKSSAPPHGAWPTLAAKTWTQTSLVSGLEPYKWVVGSTVRKALKKSSKLVMRRVTIWRDYWYLIYASLDLLTAYTLIINGMKTDCILLH